MAAPLHHAEQGTGAPLVLLHAFPLTHAMWDAERAGSAAWRILTPDLPGFGRSPRLREPSIIGMAEAVLAWLDHLGIREPIVVGGLSMGGYVALELVQRAPERVRGLGLFSTRATADTPEQRQARAALIEQVRQRGAAAALAGMRSKLLGPTTLGTNPAAVEQVTEWVGRADAGGVSDALRAMAERRDHTELLPAIACPALIVAGTEDAVVPPSASEAMARQLPRSTFVVIPGAGHLVNLEQPTRFHQALAGFLRGLV